LAPTDQSVRQKSAKKDSETSSTDGTSEKPVAEIGVEGRMVVLEVWAGVVGPGVAASVADSSSKEE